MRDNNEDSVAEDQDLGLLILADGMGGYNAGEIASGIAATTVLDVVEQAWKELSTASSTRTRLLPRIPAAQAARSRAAHADHRPGRPVQPQCAGMGTTIVACPPARRPHVASPMSATRGSTATAAASWSRSPATTRCSRSWSTGATTARKKPPSWSARTSSPGPWGSTDASHVDLLEDPLEVGDILLLCSDGLTDMVSEDQIGLCLRKYGDNLGSAAKALIEMALDGGGKDNVSVVLAKVQRSFARGRRWYERLLEWI